MDKVQNELIMGFCEVKKGVDERSAESILQWFGHVERMENDRNVKMV